MAKRLVLGLAIGGALLLLLDAVAARSGVVSGAIPKLAGTALWVTSRAAGVTAYVALSLDVVFGLFLSTSVADRLIPRARSVDVHRWLSSVALSLTAVHAVALLGDRFVRFDALDLLVPFLSSYRPLAVGLGVLALYAALTVHLSFFVRRRTGVKTWRRLHALSFLAFAAAALHGVLAGSDSGTPGLQALYVASGTLVASLGLYRALLARVAR